METFAHFSLFGKDQILRIVKTLHTAEMDTMGKFDNIRIILSHVSPSTVQSQQKNHTRKKKNQYFW